MKKKDVKVSPSVDFKEQTPKILIEKKNTDSLYKKALLSREDKSKTEFSQNTMTWD